MQSIGGHPKAVFTVTRVEGKRGEAGDAGSEKKKSKGSEISETREHRERRGEERGIRYYETSARSQNKNLRHGRKTK